MRHRSNIPLPGAVSTPPSPVPTRRTLLGGRPAGQRPAQTSDRDAATSSSALSIGDYELFLAHHATQGFSVSELARLRAMGGDAWLAEQLQPNSIDDSVTDQLLLATPSISMTGAQLFATYSGQQNGDSLIAGHLRSALVIRAVHSRRQLLERLVEFIDDLLHVPHGQGALNRLRTLYDQDMRALALGRFEDLLLASGKGAAMLVFLNNVQNVVGAPNENYSREAMELHSMGPGSGYTEVDVIEAARAFTGWSTSTNGTSMGVFNFRANRHDDGKKELPGLGLVLPAGGGVRDGELVLQALALHPATIERISRKLLSWFVRYDPPQAAVNRVVATWNATGGELREVVREVLSRTTIGLCSAWSMQKVKRPFHLVMGLLRQLQPTDTSGSYRGVVTYMESLGQPPFGWLPPNGFPDTAGAWGTSVLPRWRFADDLAHGRIAALQFNSNHVAAFYANVGAANVGQRANTVLSGGKLSASDVAEVQAYVSAAPTLNEAVLRDAIALAASCPSNQTY